MVLLDQCPLDTCIAINCLREFSKEARVGVRAYLPAALSSPNWLSHAGRAWIDPNDPVSLCLSAVTLTWTSIPARSVKLPDQTYSPKRIAPCK